MSYKKYTLELDNNLFLNTIIVFGLLFFSCKNNILHKNMLSEIQDDDKESISYQKFDSGTRISIQNSDSGIYDLSIKDEFYTINSHHKKISSCSILSINEIENILETGIDLPINLKNPIKNKHGAMPSNLSDIPYNGNILRTKISLNKDQGYYIDQYLEKNDDSESISAPVPDTVDRFNLRRGAIDDVSKKERHRRFGIIVEQNKKRMKHKEKNIPNSTELTNHPITIKSFIGPLGDFPRKSSTATPKNNTGFFYKRERRKGISKESKNKESPRKIIESFFKKMEGVRRTRSDGIIKKKQKNETQEIEDIKIRIRKDAVIKKKPKNKEKRKAKRTSFRRKPTSRGPKSYDLIRELDSKKKVYKSEIELNNEKENKNDINIEENIFKIVEKEKIKKKSCCCLCV